MTQNPSTEQATQNQIASHYSISELENTTLITLHDSDEIISLLRFAQKQHHMDMLIAICGTDYPEREARYELSYFLLSLQQNRRMIIKTEVRDLIDSSISVYPNAEWYEREVWDMLGVMFRGHPDHRRILSSYGFSGHPLRKDFPVTGYTDFMYSEETGRIEQTATNLYQDFRNFDKMSPWHGYGQLPGDEKADGEPK